MNTDTPNGWIALDSVNGVYYRAVDAVTNDTAFDILTNNKVTVSSELTKEDIKNISGNLTLKFTAYAIQKDSFGTPELAWAEVSK